MPFSVDLAILDREIGEADIDRHPPCPSVRMLHGLAARPELTLRYASIAWMHPTRTIDLSSQLLES
jgi:hypothetical protein